MRWMQMIEVSKRTIDIRIKSIRKITLMFTTAILIFFVFFISFVSFISIITAPTARAEEARLKESKVNRDQKTEKFQGAMRYANSLRNTVRVDNGMVKAGNLEFRPEDVFKGQKGGYTEDPLQVGYYGGVLQDSAEDMRNMGKAALEGISKDDDYKDTVGNPIPLSEKAGKVVLKSFQTRPVFKVTQDDEYIVKSNLVTNNANNIVSGGSSGSRDDFNYLDCENKNESQESQKNQNNQNKLTCKATYIEKTCNEEVRSILKICEKVPYIETKEELYPGCQVRVASSGKEECLIGTFGIGTHIKVVPKHLASRVEVAGSRHGYFYVTVINETTGQVLYNHSRMNNGVAFDLTFSDEQDQTFKLIADRADGCSCQWPGHLTMYIDRKYKTADVKWSEENCRDI